MNDHDDKLRHGKKHELTDADKAFLEAKPDWERAAKIAKRLMATPPDPQVTEKPALPKRPRVRTSGVKSG